MKNELILEEKELDKIDQSEKQIDKIFKEIEIYSKYNPI